jgi:hypothetical protein
VRLAKFTSGGASDVSIARDAWASFRLCEWTQRRFASLVDEFVGRAGVSVAGESARCGFSSPATKVSGSIFAMISKGRLVVNLPSGQVDTLIESATGGPLDAGKCRQVKQWLTVDDDEQT